MKKNKRSEITKAALSRLFKSGKSCGKIIQAFPVKDKKKELVEAK